MKRRVFRRRAAVLLLGSLALSAGLMLYSSSRPAPSASHPLQIAKERLDFGEVWLQSGFRWTLPVVNRAGRDMAVTGFRNTCPCVTLEPKTFTVPAGGGLALSVVLDLVPPHYLDRPETVVPYSMKIMPIFRDKSLESEAWTLSGRTRIPAKMIPAEIVFAETIRAMPGKTATAVLTFTNDVDEVTFECDDKLIEVESERVTARRFTLLVSAHGREELGAFSATILGKVRFRTGETLPGFPIGVRGRVVEDVKLQPDILRIGGSHGKTIAQVVVSTRSGKALRAVNAFIDADGGMQLAVEEFPAVTRCERSFRVYRGARDSTAGFGRLRFSVLIDGQASPVELILPVVFSGD